MKIISINNKKIFRSIFLYCFIACMPVAAISQKLVTNSGFDLGSNGWSSACSMEVNPEVAYGGTSAGNLATEIDAERCFNQNVCILPGLTYTFSFKASRRTQSQTVAAPGISFSVTGISSATQYVNVTKTYTNTVFNLQTESYSFTIPAGSADRKVNIAFANYNNTGTYGVILDDIQLAPVDANTLAIDGADILSPGEASNWSVNNATAAIAGYSWSFGATANPKVSVLAAPAGVQWAVTGVNNITAALSNGSCTVATVSKTVYIINQLLPLQFVSFTGSIKENKNQLAWSTQHEESNQYFVVERSSNGTAFDSIGMVLPAAAATVNYYLFTDAGFYTGNNYYRLRQVNKDGSYKNSVTVLIKNNGLVRAAVQLYPNPAIASIHVLLSNTSAAVTSVQIVNVSGTVLVNKKQAAPAGTSGYTLDISNLEAGMYFVKISNESGGVQSVQPFYKTK